MEKTKKTKKELYAELLAVAAVQENEELTGFINHEIELLNKKSGANKKLTKAQEENLVIKETIYDTLVDLGKAATIAEIQAEGLKEYTNQKISALLKQLVDENRVVRTEDKRKAYFEAVVDVSETDSDTEVGEDVSA